MSTLPKRGTSITFVLEREEVQIPGGIHDLAEFRQWARSPEFPERGRIDWLGGRILVDMACEDIFRHGTLKYAIAQALGEKIVNPGLGVVVVDRTRVSFPAASLSVEPDVLVLLASSVESGRVRLIPGEEQQILEIEGAPDLVVECVSKSSVRKDTRMLRQAYFEAGVTEYWLVDGRAEGGHVPEFARLEILTPGATEYAAARQDAAGFSYSPLLDHLLRIRSIHVTPEMVRWEVEQMP